MDESSGAKDQNEAAAPPRVKGGRCFLFGCLLPVLVLTLLVKVPQWSNDIRMAAFVRRVEAIGMPPESDLLLQHEEFGLLWFSSNACHFKVRLLVVTDLSEAAFRKFWADHPVTEPDKDRLWAEVWKLGVPRNEKAETPNPYEYPVWFWGEDRMVYLVIFDAGEEPGWDLRCS